MTDLSAEYARHLDVLRKRFPGVKLSFTSSNLGENIELLAEVDGASAGVQFNTREVLKDGSLGWRRPMSSHFALLMVVNCSKQLEARLDEQRGRQLPDA